MKYIFILSILFISFVGKSQTQTNVDSTLKANPDFVTVEGIIDSKNATKEGVYFNGYILHLNSDQLKKYDGEKVKVIGVVTVIKGLKISTEKLDKKSKEIIKQGRQKESYHFVSPNITLK